MTKEFKDNKDTLLTFPCDFTVKVFGLADEDFEKNVLQVVKKHVPNLADQAINSRQSGSGKYTSLSITVYVESKEQLDNLYRDLSSSPHVIMTL